MIHIKEMFSTYIYKLTHLLALLEDHRSRGYSVFRYQEFHYLIS
jgi:hypothetical protein